MINLSYRYNQNSSSLEIGGMPDVSNGDREHTIGILSFWKLKIIGSPLLEGKKEHLESLMLVILQYSRSYISGIRKTFTSTDNIVSIIPFCNKHKLLLNSTQKDVKPLEIILDDSELSDLTRTLDLLRFDKRINIRWNIHFDKPYSKRYIISNTQKSKSYLNFLYACIIFFTCSTLLFLMPIRNNNDEFIKNNKDISSYLEQNK